MHKFDPEKLKKLDDPERLKLFDPEKMLKAFGLRPGMVVLFVYRKSIQSGRWV